MQAGQAPGTATERRARQREEIVSTANKRVGLQDKLRELEAERRQVDKDRQALDAQDRRLDTLIQRCEGQIAEVETYAKSLQGRGLVGVTSRRRDRLTLGLFEAGEIVGVGR